MSWDIFSKSKIQYFLQKLKDKFVQKETGKGLSTNDYTTTDKNKVSKIDTTTTSISGNPISISGLKSNQLAVDPIITFEPIQAGSGTPSPDNIRAISGYDKVEALSCGKNLFNPNRILKGTYSNDTWQVTTEQADAVYKTSFKANTQYTFSGYEQQSATSKSVRLTVKYSDGTETNMFTDTGITKQSFTFTSAANKTIVSIGRGYASGSESPYVNITEFQIEEGTNKTTYEPYKSATSISESLGQTVYCGELDVRSGKFKIKGLYYPITSDSTVIHVSRMSGYDFFRLISIVGKPAGFIISNVFKGVTGFTGAGEVYINTEGYPIFTWMENVYNADTFKQFLIDNNAAIVYEIKNPTEIQLTPHEISLLKDYAYVSTNGTNIALDYHNGELASLADVSQLGETVNLLPYGLLKSKTYTLTPNSNGRIQLGVIDDMIPLHIICETRGIYAVLRKSAGTNYYYARCTTDTDEAYTTQAETFTVYGLPIK